MIEALKPVTSVGVVIANRDFFVERFIQHRMESPVAQIGPVDLYRSFMPWLVQRGDRVGSFDIGQPAPDLGTPDRLVAFGRG